MSRARNRPAGEIQVGERQQREHLCGVLVEAAIAHLAVAELALHDTEHMLDLRADFPEAAIAGTLVSRQPVSWFGLLLHRPQHAYRAFRFKPCHRNAETRSHTAAAP